MHFRGIAALLAGVQVDGGAFQLREDVPGAVVAVAHDVFLAFGIGPVASVGFSEDFVVGGRHVEAVGVGEAEGVAGLVANRAVPHGRKDAVPVPKEGLPDPVVGVAKVSAVVVAFAVADRSVVILTALEAGGILGHVHHFNMVDSVAVDDAVGSQGVTHGGVAAVHELDGVLKVVVERFRGASLDCVFPESIGIDLDPEGHGVKKDLFGIVGPVIVPRGTGIAHGNGEHVGQGPCEVVSIVFRNGPGEGVLVNANGLGEGLGVNGLQLRVDDPFEIGGHIALFVLAVGIDIGGPVKRVARGGAVPGAVRVLGVGILLSPFDPGDPQIPGSRSLKTYGKRENCEKQAFFHHSISSKVAFVIPFAGQLNL